MEWNWMDWKGWHGMEWNGTGWDEMDGWDDGTDKMGWDGMGWDGCTHMHVCMCAKLISLTVPSLRV